MDQCKVPADFQLASAKMDSDKENSSNISVSLVLNDLCEKAEKYCDLNLINSVTKKEETYLKPISSSLNKSAKEVDDDSCNVTETVEMAMNYLIDRTCVNEINKLLASEETESLLSIDVKPKVINTIDKQKDSVVTDFMIHTEEKLPSVEKTNSFEALGQNENSVEELDNVADDKCNLNIKAEVLNNLVCEPLVKDKEKLEQNFIQNSHQTKDIPHIEKPGDYNKENHLLLDGITLNSDFVSRKRLHSDDDDEEEEEFEIMSAAKRCFQALCESSEVMEDNDLSLPLKSTSIESSNLNEFPIISSAVSVPASVENLSNALSCSKTDMQQLKKTALKELEFSKINDDDNNNKPLSSKVKSSISVSEEESSTDREGKLKENFSNLKSENPSLEQLSYVDQHNSHIFSEDDDIEVLTPEKFGKLNHDVSLSTDFCSNKVENHNIKKGDLESIENSCEENYIKSDISEKIIDKNVYDVSTPEIHNINDVISEVPESNND